MYVTSFAIPTAPALLLALFHAMQIVRFVHVGGRCNQAPSSVHVAFGLLRPFQLPH